MSSRERYQEPGARRVPLWLYACWHVYDFITWPLTVRQLRRAGFTRTGWMTWSAGALDDDPWAEDGDG